MKTPSSLRLSTWLALFVALIALPLLAFAGLELWTVLDANERERDAALASRARAIASAVDAEIRSWRAALYALAESSDLRAGRFGTFRDQARAVAARYDGWIVVIDAAGQQHVNTLLPDGTPLPRSAANHMVNAVLRERLPVTDFTFGAAAQRHVVSNAVPAFRDGTPTYCLALNFGPERLTRLLQEQKLPSTWITAVVDGQYLVVARSSDAEKRVGKPAPAALRQATTRADAGVVTYPLIDGREARVAFQRLAEVPWMVALAVPVSELPALRPLFGFGWVGLLLALVAVGAAAAVGRTIGRPIRRLADRAPTAASADPVVVHVGSRVQEVNQLQRALAEGAERARAATEQRDRAEEELRRANAELEARVQERMAALQQALAEAEEGRRLIEAVLHALPVGMALVDVEGGSVRANAAYEHVWGGPRPPTRTVADYVAYKAWWADSGRPLQPAEWASAQAVQQKRPVIGQLLQIERFDGTRAFVLNSAAPILDAEGEAIGAAVAIQDITELRTAQESLRRSEALYRAIGESIDYGVWVCNRDGRNTYASPSFLKMVGLTQAQCSDFGWGEVLHPDDADRTIASWKECVRTGGNWDIEHRFRGVDGQWHDVLARGVPVKDERGEVLCWAGINLDISRLKRAETALRQLNTELEQRVTERTVELSRAVQILERQATQLRTITAELTLAEQRERRRLADVLHDELQQLLVATRLRAYMLGSTPDSAVRQGAQEIVALIEEALGQTRSLTGELSPPTLQKGGLVPALEWLIRWMGEKHHLTVQLVPPPVPLPSLPEDTAVLMYQAVRECLLNTVKYAQVSEATVTVSGAESELTVTVADAGVGFDSARLRVFGGPEGGVGLLGIRERLEWIGGHLEIASAPGQGSRLTLVAPLGRAVVHPATSPAAAPADVVPDSRAAHRVLVVDDHALVRRGFATLLAGEPDLEVVGEAENGQQAVETTRRLVPDVVLMDVNMPVMNGIDATRVIHAEFPAIRVIGLSMFDDPEQPEAMRQAGAAGYLRKSEPAEALFAAIRGGGAPAA